MINCKDTINCQIVLKLTIPEENFNKFATNIFETTQYFVNDLANEFGTVGDIAVVKYERGKE